MHMARRRRPHAVAISVATLLASPAAWELGLQSAHAGVTVTFDTIESLDQLECLGITFEGGMAIWRFDGAPGMDCSVLEDPLCGPVTAPHGLCGADCGGAAAGIILLERPQPVISMYALSGPGPDLITPGTMLVAYDEKGGFVGMAEADPTLQFQELTIVGGLISRIEVISLAFRNEAWDNLTLGVNPVCLGDLDSNGVVDGADLGLQLALWGICEGESCIADLNLDGEVNGADVGLLLVEYGLTCPECPL